MRMEDEASWDSQGISDQHVQQSEDERKAVQKRTFTRWMNMFLQRCEPPIQVFDLFTDIQDGRILMALLEELSGCKLLYRFRSSSHRNFRLNNISKTLAFLDDRHVKLLGIDASGIADGIPSVVLNLIWNIILHFQVKEVTGGLQRHLSSSLSSLSMSSYPSSSDLSPQPNDIGSYSSNTLPRKGRNAAREPKYHGKAIKTLLHWVQRCTSQFGVEVNDFGKSWRSGLAFLAMIKSINPALIDLRESLSREPRENIQQAFMIAHHSLDIPPLLEPEDVACISPDEQSIITYVSMFLRHYSGIDEDYPSTDIEVNIPEIPNFGSLEALSFGETSARDPEAKGLLRGLEKSNEQQLWKQWARRSSGGLHTTLRHMNGAVTSDFSTSSDIFPSCRSQSVTEQTVGTSQVNKRRGSVLEPPSPLDTGVFSQEIRSWMEKGSVDQSYSKPKRDESYISLSSEEGIYNLSALDSEEDDAYSYSLDLNKEVFQPYNHLKRIPRLEEETAEEIILNGQLIEESEQQEASETLNDSGCKHQEGSLAQNADFDQAVEVRALSVDHRKFDLDKNESIFREMANNRAVFDIHPPDESRAKGEHEEERADAGQSNDDGEEERERERTENARLVRNGYNETESLVVEVACRRKEAVEETEGGLSEKCGQVSERRDKEEEEEHLLMFKKGQNRGLRKERDDEDDVKEEERGNQQSVVNLQMMMTGNEKILIDEAEVRKMSVDAISTKEESDERDAKMEDLTKNCRDEENEEDPNEVKHSIDLETVDEKDRELEIKRHKQLTEKKTTIIHHPGATTWKNDTDGGVHGHDDDIHLTSCPTSQSSSEEGFILQSLAASCDLTPLELEMLLFLWILLYCCLILPQMNH